ncbi:MAG: LacI family DNA-binding transcriptional regulator [Rhodobacteraceae bacterium]|jgi:DNA-binding LacI/PurR family transcriptional regulator|nr:LacI family DNA-binding transcriptional regulator [Paracoccaceae bacterium]
MANVGDVARRAGVSIATVSRVLNGTAVVAEDTRERVLKAAADLYYTPNRAARNLRAGRSNTVAFAVSDIEQSEVAAIAKYLQPTLQTIGLDCILYSLAHSGDRLMRLLREAEQFGVSAVVIVSPDLADEGELAGHAARLAGLGIRVIAVNNDRSHLGIASVLHDDVAATALSVGHLIANGRVPVAYLGRHAGSRAGQARRQGYVTALQAAGLPVDPDLTWDFAYRSAAGYEAVDRALARGLAFAAIQCGSDELAMGAIAALQDHRIRVPEDVAVVGFSNSPWAMYLRPALTTLSSSPQHLALAVRDLLSGQGEMPLRTLIRRDFLRRSSA